MLQHRSARAVTLCSDLIKVAGNCLHTFFRARRAAKEAKEAPAQPAPAKVKVEVKKFVKIGRPGYKGRQALAFYMAVTVWFLILVSLQNTLSKKLIFFF